MPLVDMPLEQLYTYGGRNPRPDGFDAYWERAIRQLEQQNDELELVPSNFQTPYAECIDLFYTGVGNAKVHAKYVRPVLAKAPHPAVVLFHGYGHYSGDWSEKLIYAALGFSVLALDCRGQGGLSEDSGRVKGTTWKGHIIRGLDDHPDQLLYRQIFLDAAQLARIAMSLPEVDPTRVSAVGASQGGGLALACAALEPRIHKVVSAVPFLADYQRVWEMDLARDAYEELRVFFRHHDPQHERQEEIFNRLGYIDVQHLAERVRAEVLLGVGLLDTVCPPSTQFAVYNKLIAAKRLELYPDFTHERLPGFEDKGIQFLLEK